MNKFILAFLFAVRIASAQNDIIVDNPQAVFTGKWTTGHASPDRFGADYNSTVCVAGEATATAIFRPEIASAGKYNVEVMYPRGDNRSTNAPCLISGKDGTFKTNINQKISGGKWVRIANGVEFEAGKNGFVQLSNNSGEDQETVLGRIMVIADAVRFVLASKAPLTTASTTTASTTLPASISSAGADNRASVSASSRQYSLQTAVHGNGTLRKTPDQPGYAEHETVQLTAAPDKGYVFAGWTGDAVGLDNPITVPMKKNASITAEFLPEAPGVILESSQAILEGPWASNSQKWPGQRSDSYAYVGALSEARSSAVFRPNLPKAGKYDVYIYYLHGDNRATKTRWEIVSKGGSSTVEVDQRQNGGAWFQIASGMEFEAGTGGYVKVTNKAEPISGVVVADSVAFVYSGPPDQK